MEGEVIPMDSSLAMKQISLFDIMTDEEVVELAKTSDVDALEYLIHKYKGLVRAKARTYFLIGADKEDIIQEGMIGLYKAIRDFNKDKLVSFKAFAELCVTRQIITAVKTATRQKHIPLNNYISLNRTMFESDMERTLMDTLSSEKLQDPEEIFITKEDFTDINLKMEEKLSHFEMQVLNLYIQGKSYLEIAEGLKKPVKSIDNALQRIKKKLSGTLQSDHD